MRRFRFGMLTALLLLFGHHLISDTATPDSAQGLVETFAAPIVPQVPGRVVEMAVTDDLRGAACDRLPLDPAARHIAIEAAAADLATDGAAGAWPRHAIDDAFEGADGVDLVDIDGDGDLDAVVGWEEAGGAFLYENPGPDDVRERWPRTTVSGGLDLTKIEDVRFADFDDDGLVDAVVTATESHNMKVGIHWLVDRARFTSPESWKGAWIDPTHDFLFVRIAIGQVDGIGANDIVVGTKEKNHFPGKVVLYRAPGQPTFTNASEWRGIEIAEVGWVKNLEIVDVDGDGRNDIVFVGNEGLEWFENRGVNRGSDGNVGWAKHVISTKARSYFRVCSLNPEIPDDWSLVAGVNTSSRSDLDLAAYIISPTRSAAGAWTGQWSLEEVRSEGELPRDPGSDDYVTKGIACGDLNGDQRTDLVITTSGFGVGVFAVLQQPLREGRVWRTQNVSSTEDNNWRKGIKHDNVELADLDLDGDLDIITTEENAGRLARGLGVVWFENLSGTRLGSMCAPSRPTGERPDQRAASRQ